VGDEPTVILDSGIRTGADVFKALAMGADAVTIGRPHIYGLALDGRHGVADVVRNIVAELDLTMALSGARAVADIDRARPCPFLGADGTFCIWRATDLLTRLRTSRRQGETCRT
jgi:isopentenyl diphosphate isomerase/L-lactate dehydrogenase-like FMN-dependent dehydrogenase